MLSEAYGVGAIKSQVFLSGINGLERIGRTWKMKEMIVLRSYRTNENVEKVWNLEHSNSCVSINQAYYVEILKQLCEAMHTKGSELLSTMTMLYLTRHSLSSSFWKLVTEM
jgi:hypothetical protein